MRREVTMTALAAALLVAAACGGDDGDDGGGGDGGGGDAGNDAGTVSTDDVCARFIAEGYPAQDRAEEAFGVVDEAGRDGDRAALEVALEGLAEPTDELVQLFRELASDAADDELSGALEAMAGVYQATADSMVELGPDRMLSGDIDAEWRRRAEALTTEFYEVAETLDGICGAFPRASRQPTGAAGS